MQQTSSLSDGFRLYLIYFPAAPNPSVIRGQITTNPTEEPPLSLDTILAELKAERDRLNQAIAALEGVTRPERPNAAAAPPKRRKRGRAKMSAKTRQRLSEAKKEWWAKKKGEGSGKRRSKSGI